MAKDKSDQKDPSKKRKRDGVKSPSPLSDPETAKVTKIKSEKKDKKKEKSKDKEKSEKKDKKEKKEKKKDKAIAEDGGVSMLDTSTLSVEKPDDVDALKMEIDTEGVIKGGTMADVKLIKDRETIANALVPFAKPLAEGKLAKKVLKTVKKAAKTKALKRGVKEVVKSLRKSANHISSSSPSPLTTPLLILAGDISPADVISHLPVLAEDHGIPYVFVTSRAELGAAGATKRPTSVVMITPDTAGSKRGKKGKKAKEGAEGEENSRLEKIKEEEEEFRSAYKDLVKEVYGVTKALLV